MSARIYEIAGALHKGTEQVLKDLQKSGVKVSKISDLVSDHDMLKIAEQYGRKEFVYPLISSEYISELANSWSQEDILKLLLDITWTEGFLSEKDAKRLLAVKACVPDRIEEVINSDVKYKNPKAVCSLYLIGTSEKALMIPKEESDFQMFLIPKSKKDAAPCCICFGENKILYTSINVDSCMVLVWADGKYYYRSAKFSKMQDMYLLEVEPILQEMEIKLPVYKKVNWNNKGIWTMSKWLQPGKSGFAMQEKRKCSIKFDKEKLRICGGEVEQVAWIAKDAKSTIKGALAVRQVVDAFLGNTGELDDKSFQKEENRLKEAVKVEQILIDDLLDDNEDKKIDLAVEAYVRLRLLEQMGLSKKAVDAFAKERKLYVSRGTDGCTPLQDRFLEKRIRKFEAEYQVVAYHCVLTKEEKGMIANIFYVADFREKWAKERVDIQKKRRVVVRRENLSDKSLSKAERIQFYMINGGLVCI